MSQKTQPDSMPYAEAVDLPEISVEHSTEFLTGSAALGLATVGLVEIFPILRTLAAWQVGCH
ncbi:TPA: hypothetical protein ACQQS5_000657 [Pseudomonas aeruginosa]